MRTKRKKVVEECAFENAITDNGSVFLNIWHFASQMAQKDKTILKLI